MYSTGLNYNTGGGNIQTPGFTLQSSASIKAKRLASLKNKKKTSKQTSVVDVKKIEDDKSDTDSNSNYGSRLIINVSGKRFEIFEKLVKK